MGSADSFMNWGFNPKGQGASEDIIFIYSTMYAYEEWWDATLHRPSIYWSLEEALTQISNIIHMQVLEHFENHGAEMDESNFWFSMDYHFQQIPAFSLETTYSHYLPQRVYPQYRDGEGIFNPWDLGVRAEAQNDFERVYRERLQRDLQLWKEDVLEYNKGHPLQNNDSRQYRNWIFEYVSEEDYHNHQGRMWMVQHP